MAGPAEKSAQPLVLGRISGVFGVAGWVKLFSYTDPREAILKYRHWLRQCDGEWIETQWDQGRRQGKTVVAHFKGVDDRESAERLVGQSIGIWRQELPQAGGDSYYWADLEGLTVITQDGQELGRVAYLIATGANDVLVVQGDQEILIPFVTGTYVLDVDLAAGVIRVDWEWD